MNNVFIILVKPQLGQNIGSVARVMKNLNFKNLRIGPNVEFFENIKIYNSLLSSDNLHFILVKVNKYAIPPNKPSYNIKMKIMLMVYMNYITGI